MMKFIKLPLLLICMSVMTIAVAQQPKTKFKQITLVAYHPIFNGKEGHAQFYVMDYSIRFYDNDSLHYTANNFTRVTPDRSVKFRFGMSDTAYLTPTDLISELNKVFNGKSQLKSHMITDKLPDGSDGYDDEVYFITYTTDNTSDTFIAVPPFLDKKLKNLLDQVNTLPRGNNWILKKVYHDSALEQTIKDFEKTVSYVPAPTPPKVSQLQIADPGVKH